MQFENNSTAGNAQLTNEGASERAALGGTIQFIDNATAGGTTIVNKGGNNKIGAGGEIFFFGLSNAGTANITNNGSANDGLTGSVVIGARATAQRCAVQNQRQRLAQ